MTHEVDKLLPYRLIEQTVGIDIKILSNEYQELPGMRVKEAPIRKLSFRLRKMTLIYMPLEFSFAYLCYLSLLLHQEAILKKNLSLMSNLA